MRSTTLVVVALLGSLVPATAEALNRNQPAREPAEAQRTEAARVEQPEPEARDRRACARFRSMPDWCRR